MGLLRRRPPLPGPDAPLEEHLDAFAAARPGAAGALVRALAARDLWQAAREQPAGIPPHQEVVLQEDLPLELLTTTLPDGGRAYAVFSTEAQVHARNPQAWPVRRPGADVLAELLVDEGAGGLVLDPAGRWQVLLTEWVRDGLAGR